VQTGVRIDTNSRKSLTDTSGTAETSGTVEASRTTDTIGSDAITSPVEIAV